MQHRPTRTTATAQARLDDWVLSAYREVIRVLGRRPRLGREPQEIAGEVADELYGKGSEGLARHIAAHPDPEKWARQRAHHACIQHDRDERVQRCQGTRLVRNDDGTMQPQRTLVWGNAPVHGDDGASLGERFDTLGLGHDSFEDHLVDTLDAHQRLRQYTTGLGRREVAEIVRIDGFGEGVGEVADACGQQRETVSRRVNATRRTIRQNAEWCARAGEEDPA